MTESDDLGQYLGCPIIQDRVTKETFSPVIARAKSQLSKWKANSLSKVGRAVLIQMQFFLLPKSTLSSLDKVSIGMFFGIKILTVNHRIS